MITRRLGILPKHKVQEYEKQLSFLKSALATNDTSGLIWYGIVSIAVGLATYFAMHWIASVVGSVFVLLLGYTSYREKKDTRSIRESSLEYTHKVLRSKEIKEVLISNYSWFDFGEFEDEGALIFINDNDSNEWLVLEGQEFYNESEKMRKELLLVYTLEDEYLYFESKGPKVRVRESFDPRVKQDEEIWGHSNACRFFTADSLAEAKAKYREAP